MNTQRGRLTALAQRMGWPLAVLLLLAGHFAPWAAHKTAALTLSAHELAVFTNFTPGAGIFLNEWFYLPLWCAALIIALLAGSSSWINRALMGLLSAAVASLGLPGYPQVLTAFRSPDYRLQFFASLAVMLVCLVVALLTKGGRWQGLRPVITGILALVSAVPLAGYLMIKPAVEQLYRDPLGLGAGWWLTLLAIALLLVTAALSRARAPA